MAFIDELRDKQSERARAKLAREGREYDVGRLDPEKFQPLRMMTKNGLPDIEALKRNFVHQEGRRTS